MWVPRFSHLYGAESWDSQVQIGESSYRVHRTRSHRQLRFEPRPVRTAEASRGQRGQEKKGTEESGVGESGSLYLQAHLPGSSKQMEAWDGTSSNRAQVIKVEWRWGGWNNGVHCPLLGAQWLPWRPVKVMGPEIKALPTIFSSGGVKGSIAVATGEPEDTVGCPS